MYLGGGGIEVDLPVAYQQLIEQIFLTAAGLARAGAFQRVGDTVELDAQGQNVKNIAAGGFDLALSPTGADGFLRDAVVAAALLAPDSIAAYLHAVAVRIGGDLQAQPRVDQTDGGEHPVIALELEHIVRTGQDRQQCEGGRGRKPFVVAGQAAEAFVNIQNPAQDRAIQLSVVCKQRFFVSYGLLARPGRWLGAASNLAAPPRGAIWFLYSYYIAITTKDRTYYQISLYYFNILSAPLRQNRRRKKN